MKNSRHANSALCSLLATNLMLLNSWVSNAEPAAASTSANPAVPENATSATKPDGATACCRPAGWKYLNEQEWLVDAIGRDIAEILGYAKNGRASGGFARGDVNLSTKTEDLKSGAYSYSAKIGRNGPSLDYKLILVDYIWSPKTYEPFTKEILRSLDIQPSIASQVPDQFLKNISKSELKFLFVENERISKALSENPLDASLHEQAALLLGIFASLEVCGSFTDERALLSRMSTHLTLARALNQDKLGHVGEMANAILESLACRKKVALDVVQQLESQSQNPVEKSILRAIKMRINHDPRAYDEAHSTPLEDLIFGQFYTQSRTIEDAMTRFGKNDVPLTQQWRRVLGAGRQSVASGSQIHSKMVSSEMSEFIACRNAYKNVQDDNFSSFCEELNLLPSGCLSNLGETPPLNVLSWELICASFQRHLAYAILVQYQHYKWALASKEMGQREKDEAYRNFSKLSLFPFVADRFILTGDERRAVYVGIKQLLTEHPEAVPEQVWKMSIRMAAKNTTIPHQSPPPEAWFEPPMPAGTVFIERSDQKNFPKSLAVYESLRRLNPYDPYLAVAWAREKYGEFPTAEQWREAFGPLPEYDVQAMRVVCRGEIHNSEKFIALVEKIAKEDPKIYMDAADFCVINSLPEKAAEFYEKAFDTVPDSISIANHSDWLVMYLYDSGERKKAEELALSAAAVYSRRGLQTLGRLYERQGRLNEAEEQYKLIEERYDNDSPLLAFYLRHKEKNARYEMSAADLLAKIFPSGLTKVSLASFSGAPDKGVYVQSLWWISDSPLKYDTIIVGVNGYSVTTKDQYDVAKELTADQKYCSVIYWDGKEYKERKEPTIHHNSIGFDVVELRRPKQAGVDKP